MMDVCNLKAKLESRFSGMAQEIKLQCGEITMELGPSNLLNVALVLRDEADFLFDTLIDVCGVDYLHYGLSDWETTEATSTGFERGVDVGAFDLKEGEGCKNRFAVVIHLLSVQHNHRLRLRVWLDENNLTVPSVTDIWPAANWFEREAFDLFGIVFAGHADLRRILTDYGFIGHPFRKDFPLSGHVEARYDAARQQVVYEPVSIKKRILEPKVIRDNVAQDEGSA